MSEKLQGKFDVITDSENLGTKKNIFKEELMLLNIKSPLNKLLLFSMSNNFEEMKNEVIYFLADKN